MTTKPRTAKSQGKKASGSKPSVTSPKKEIKRKADWYDYPEYFDLGFQDETEKEVVFLKEAFKRFGSGPVKRILEPGCGSGRLVVRLAELGYDVTGFDLSESMLKFLDQRLKRKGLKAKTYLQDMSHFEVAKPYDCVLNTFNTFRHLMNDEAALGHLKSVAAALRKGGLFFFGLHLMPKDADDHCIERWRAHSGKTSVFYTLRVVNWDRKKREETLRVCMLIRKPNQEPIRVQSELLLRTYRLPQMLALLRQVPELELVETFDFWYEIDEPIKLSEDICDTLFVLRKR